MPKGWRVSPAYVFTVCPGNMHDVMRGCVGRKRRFRILQSSPPSEKVFLRPRRFLLFALSRRVSGSSHPPICRAAVVVGSGGGALGRHGPYYGFVGGPGGPVGEGPGEGGRGRLLVGLCHFC